MLTQIPANDVLVISTGTQEVVRAGRALRLLPGVSCVTADPERRQVLVRYDTQALAAGRIVAELHPDGPQSSTVSWLIKLPKIARAISAAASLLS